MERSTITAYIRCYQDPELLLKCAEHLLWVDEILIADNSKDNSVENIINELKHKNLKYCKTEVVDWRHRLISLKNHVNSDYILMVDTDEYYTKEAADEILSKLSDIKNEKEGYIIPSESYLYCEYFNKGANQLRLFKKNSFYIEFKSVHEMPKVNGSVELLKHGYDHYNSPTLSSQIFKVFHYAQNDAAILDNTALDKHRTDNLSTSRYKLHLFYFLVRMVWRSRGFFFSRKVTIVDLWLRYIDFCNKIALDITPTEEIRKRAGKKY